MPGAICETEELDYYGILGLDRSANGADVKLAFRRLALRAHPDVQQQAATAGKKGQAAEFARICLSEDFTRAVEPGAVPKAVGQEVSVSVGLEEVFTGCVKDVLTGAEGQPPLKLSVPAGVAEGARFTFPGRAKGGGDLCCVVKVAPHARYSRQGAADLAATVHLTLLQALTGTVAELRTLDGRQLSIPVAGAISEGSGLLLEGEGLPLQEGEGKGDLHVTFHITFPTALTPAQRGLLKAALLLPTKPSPPQAAAVDALQKAFQDPKGGWQAGLTRSAH